MEHNRVSPQSQLLGRARRRQNHVAWLIIYPGRCLQEVVQEGCFAGSQEAGKDGDLSQVSCCTPQSQCPCQTSKGDAGSFFSSGIFGKLLSGSQTERCSDAGRSRGGMSQGAALVPRLYLHECRRCPCNATANKSSRDNCRNEQRCLENSDRAVLAPSDVGLAPGPSTKCAPTLSPGFRAWTSCPTECIAKRYLNIVNSKL